MAKSKPKLRTVDKSLPPFPLTEFPKDFPFILGWEYELKDETKLINKLKYKVVCA